PMHFAEPYVNLSQGQVTSAQPLRSADTQSGRWQRYFYMLAAGHLVVWTLVCLATQPNATLDTVEMVFWGRHWLWGYYKHPPLPAWISSVLLDLGGGSLVLLYAVAQAGTVTCMWAVWRLARELVSLKLAFFSAALLECSYYYTFA